MKRDSALRGVVQMAAVGGAGGMVVGALLAVGLGDGTGPTMGFVAAGGMLQLTGLLAGACGLAGLVLGAAMAVTMPGGRGRGQSGGG